MSDLIVIPAICFFASMLATYVAVSLASGTPLTPWFVRQWMRDAAQAIEARRAKTGTGLVEDESAVPKECAQTPPQSPSYSKYRGSVDQ